MKCELCNLEVSDIKFLNRHMANVHRGIDRKLYYDTYLKQLEDGTCKNCGKSTKYINLVQGYQDICDKCKFDIAHTRTCIICNNTFVSRDSRSICCDNPECKKLLGHIKYKNNTVECICKNCNLHYIATEKQSKEYCPLCIRKILPINYKNKVIQNHCCRKCKKILYTVEKNVTANIPEYMYDKTCDYCKQLNLKQLSYRMKLNNPSYDHSLTIEEYNKKQQEKEYYKSESYKLQRNIEIKKQFSDRMKENNPMYNKDVRDKTSKTLKSRYADGTIKKYYGKDNWLYKGTRTIKGYLRLCLGDWIKSNLIRTDYTCEICHKRGGTLHVHHKEQFAKLVNNGIKELNLDINNLEFRSDDYQKLEKWILDYHNSHDIGLVVCQKCHAKVDKRYFAPKKLYENN